MPARIQSMSSTMRIVGCRLSEFFIEPFPARSCSQFLCFYQGWGSRVCPLPYLLENLHIRGLLTAYGESAVAFAGYRLDHLPIIDAQISAPVTDRSRVLHSRGRDRHTGAAHAQVLGYSLLSNLNHIIFDAVYKEQQPDRKSLLNRMENRASGTL